MRGGAWQGGRMVNVYKLTLICCRTSMNGVRELLGNLCLELRRVGRRGLMDMHVRIREDRRENKTSHGNTVSRKRGRL